MKTAYHEVVYPWIRLLKFHSLPANPPTIILIRPEHPGNIGSVARAMMNFGLSDLRLVQPRSDWLQNFTRQMASGASEILETAKIYETTEEALSDLQLVCATAAYVRDMVKKVFTPAQAMKEVVVPASRAAIKTGLMMGTEKSGLTNEEVMRAHHLITIPTSSDFDSLNLAQAVVILGYAWLTAQTPPTFSEEFLSGHPGPLATGAELESFFIHLESYLDEANFWRCATKRPDMRRNLRALFLRQPLTGQEVRTLHGVVRSLVEYSGPGWKSRQSLSQGS